MLVKEGYLFYVYDIMEFVKVFLGEYIREEIF